MSGLHGLKSAKRFDWETCIADGTHVQMHFTIYNDPDDTSKGWTSYEVIISNEELFELLKDRAIVEVQGALYGNRKW
jgi:hypothetical protein